MPAVSDEMVKRASQSLQDGPGVHLEDADVRIALEKALAVAPREVLTREEIALGLFKAMDWPWPYEADRSKYTVAADYVLSLLQRPPAPAAVEWTQVSREQWDLWLGTDQTIESLNELLRGERPESLKPPTLTVESVRAALKRSAAGANELLEQTRSVFRAPERDLRLGSARVTVPGEQAEPPCTHEGIGLPMCKLCDPRTKREGGPQCDQCAAYREQMFALGRARDGMHTELSAALARVKELEAQKVVSDGIDLVFCPEDRTLFGLDGSGPWKSAGGMSEHKPVTAAEVIRMAHTELRLECNRRREAERQLRDAESELKLVAEALELVNQPDGTSGYERASGEKMAERARRLERENSTLIEVQLERDALVAKLSSARSYATQTLYAIDERDWTEARHAIGHAVQAAKTGPTVDLHERAVAAEAERDAALARCEEIEARCKQAEIDRDRMGEHYDVACQNRNLLRTELTTRAEKAEQRCKELEEERDDARFDKDRSRATHAKVTGQLKARAEAAEAERDRALEALEGLRKDATLWATIANERGAGDPDQPGSDWDQGHRQALENCARTVLMAIAHAPKQEAGQARDAGRVEAEFYRDCAEAERRNVGTLSGERSSLRAELADTKARFEKLREACALSEVERKWLADAREFPGDPTAAAFTCAEVIDRILVAIAETAEQAQSSSAGEQAFSGAVAVSVMPPPAGEGRNRPPIPLELRSDEEQLEFFRSVVRRAIADDVQCDAISVRAFAFSKAYFSVDTRPLLAHAIVAGLRASDAATAKPTASAWQEFAEGIDSDIQRHFAGPPTEPQLAESDSAKRDAKSEPVPASQEALQGKVEHLSRRVMLAESRGDRHERALRALTEQRDHAYFISDHAHAIEAALDGEEG